MAFALLLHWKAGKKQKKKQITTLQHCMISLLETQKKKKYTTRKPFVKIPNEMLVGGRQHFQGKIYLTNPSFAEVKYNYKNILK